jgi:hypothetical protein
MLERVEKNLSLLVSCNKSTRAAAKSASNNNAVKTSPLSCSSESGYMASDSLDNDGKYHHNLALILVRMLLNDQSSCQTVPIHHWRGMVIDNHPMLILLVKCLKSQFPSLALVAARVVLALVAINPVNAISLEVEGVIASMLDVFTTILYRGKLVEDDADTMGKGKTIFIVSDFDKNAPLPFHGKMVQLVSVIVEALQVLSANFCSRDMSIPTVMLSILVSGWADMPDESFEGQKYRCLNCEVELAVWQCLNERLVFIASVN